MSGDRHQARCCPFDVVQSPNGSLSFGVGVLVDVGMGELEVSVGVVMVGNWGPVGSESHRCRY